MSIYKKLIEVQNELKAPKGQYNKFGKYAYRKADDILEAVKPLLKNKGLAIVLSDKAINLGLITTKKRNDVVQGETVNTVGGERKASPSFDKSTEASSSDYSVMIEAVATIFDETGAEVSATAQAGIEKAGGMQLPQAYGSASSYARKYAMSGLFAIDDENDPDRNNEHNKTAKPAAKKPAANKKPELTPSHKHWAAAVTHVAGGGDIEVDILGKYVVTESNQKLLVSEAEKASK